MTTLRKLHFREVPKEWEDRLAEHSPPTNRFSWLKLVWEPGYPWEAPVERYMLMQMIPAHAVEPYVLEQLEDPHPPSMHGNYYDAHLTWTDETGAERIGKFVNNPDCLITEQAWRLFRETRCWGKRYWVMQGEKGGHKYRFTKVEQQMLRLLKLPTEPPEPGTLPYAPFDDRVLAQLEKLDMLKGVHGGLRRQKAILAGAHSERYEESERALRAAVMGMLKEQVEQIAGDVHQALMKLDAPRTRDGDAQRDMEEQSEIAEDNWIRTGQTNAGLSLLK